MGTITKYLVHKLFVRFKSSDLTCDHDKKQKSRGRCGHPIQSTEDTHPHPRQRNTGDRQQTEKQFRQILEGQDAHQVRGGQENYVWVFGGVIIFWPWGRGSRL
jgi:hypothetical protein